MSMLEQRLVIGSKYFQFSYKDCISAMLIINAYWVAELYRECKSSHFDTSSFYPRQKTTLIIEPLNPVFNSAFIGGPSPKWVGHLTIKGSTSPLWVEYPY